jgi:hypothetical protein
MRRTWLLLLLGLAACKFGGETADDSPGDPPEDAGPPTALGNGYRIHDLVKQLTSGKGALTGTSSSTSGVNETVTGASLIIVDNYDETHNGKSIGSVYVQDVASTLPYSGIELYKPTYTPSNLIISPGDVIDMTGLYQNYAYTGFTDPKVEVIPEFSEPVVSFRFEWRVATPAVITNLEDLSGNVANSTDPTVFAQGLRWESMLVEVDNVTISGTYMDSAGRLAVYFTPDTTSGPAIANQLMPLDGNAPMFKTGTVFKKVIGVCGYFYNFTISPRSMADLVPE